MILLLTYIFILANCFIFYAIELCIYHGWTNKIDRKILSPHYYYFTNILNIVSTSSFYWPLLSYSCVQNDVLCVNFAKTLLLH